jgi:hypothetical protein
MTATLTTTTPMVPVRGTLVTPTILRGGMLAVMIGALIAGFLVTGTEAANLAIAQYGAELTRLLRFMAAVKAVIAVAGSGAVLWRLGSAISLPRFAAYALTCAVMATGPGLIWSMSHVALGALLFHGGLFATILLFWNDPAVSARLVDMVAVRRQQIASRTG